MPTVLLPPVPYDRTSIRPGWEDLPAAFRDALSARLGGKIIEARVAGTGFTPGFAAVLTTALGQRCFVKAADLSTPVAQWYRRESELTSALPQRVPVARPLWYADIAGYFVLCLDVIDGARPPSLPWAEHELTAALHAHAEAAAALADPPAALLGLGPSPWHTVLDELLSTWRGPTPPAHPRAAELARLEARLDELTRDATTLMHCDLRLDNVVIDSRGQAWICDWNHLCFGPPWFDTMTLLLSAEAGGLDVDRLFANHPTTTDLPADALDAALAAMAGFYVANGAQPEVESSPALRGHQRYYGTLALRWLSRRRGWL